MNIKLKLSCYVAANDAGFTEDVTISNSAVFSSPEQLAAGLRTLYENASPGLEVVQITQMIEVERGYC
jgi:hypothetical protein